MLSDKQQRAAFLKANGRSDIAIINAVGVHKATYYRWLKKSEFNKAVAEAQAKIEAENPITPEEAEADLETARDADRKVLAFQNELIGELNEFTLDWIRHIREQGVEELSVRQFPSFCKAVIEVTNAMQATQDRLVGIEALITDVEEVEAALQHVEQQPEGEAA